MKVLFLYKGKSAGGDNRVVVTQGESLALHGVTVDYIPVTGKGPRGYLKALSAIRKRLRTGDTDIIHAHYGISGIAGLTVAGRTPIVVSFMGSDLLGSRSRRGRIKAWSRLMINVHVFLARYFYSFTVVKSAGMQKKLLRNTKHAVIPNGVNTGLFRPEAMSSARERLNLDREEFIVLFPAGRQTPEKNHALAAASMNELSITGARLLEINDADHEKMPLYFNAADLVLITSFHEGSPNIVKEAMACNCPVVSTAVGDIEWLTGGLPGHYLTDFDSAAVAAKIREAILFRREHGFTGGRLRILELGLDADSVAERIIGHYNGIMMQNE
jgi:glycosyltransferase involved in cell wall biosynthesis